jgi:pectinesterase
MDKKLFLSFLLGIFLSVFSSFVSHQPVTIFMIGDSTMADKDLSGGNLERGWGEMLPGFFSEQVCIENHALNGRSSKSFIAEGHWREVISRVKSGDYVFIQFGHNDEKTDTARHTAVGSTFDANIKRFISETRSKGGIPVLFTSIVRRKFNKDGMLEDTHGAYVTEIRKIASECNALLIDMNKLTQAYVQRLGEEGSKKLYMWVAKGKYAFCPEGKQDNTHLNVYGARRVASMAADEICSKIPSFSAYLCHNDYCVAKDGSGDFFTVQEAVNAVPDYRKNRTTIRVRKGVYEEKLMIASGKQNITLVGDEGAVIRGNDYASKRNAFGEEMGTSGSSSCYIYGNDFCAENITFENQAGPVGQAVAVLVDGDRCVFKHCRFLGNQDTLYTFGKTHGTRQYYEDCYIEGTTDFIFGWAVAVFNACEIHSKANSYITAASTPQEQKYGYLFYRCRITADEAVGKCYLGRPWRPAAKVIFYECELGRHILPVGWHNWGKVEAESQSFFAEYHCTGVGADTKKRVSWAHLLSDDQAKEYAVQKFLEGNDGWNPMK